MKWRVRTAATTIFTALLAVSTVLASVTSGRGPSGCPLSVDAQEYICLTVAEARAEKMAKLDLQGQILDLREENLRLRSRVPSGLRRFATPWATVGAERLLNDGTYHGYGVAGLDFGHVSFWGGIYGDNPAAGVGWRF